MAGNLSWLRRRSVSLPLLLLLLTAICSVWISYTSWYFEESRDKYLRFSAQSSVALSKSVWIVIGDGIDLQFREVFENNTRRLSAESVIIGEMSQINGMIRVSYPLSGWVNYHQNSIIRLEELLADPNIISNISKGTCSDVISVLPDSGCIERLLSWENQWPIGNGKFGGLVGGSYSVNVIPLSLAGFYVAPSHSGARDVSQQTIKFQRSRKLLLEGEFEASQTTLSSVIRSQAMSTFQSLFDLIFFFLPEGLVQLEHIPTSEPSDTMKSRMDMLHEMQKLLFGKLIQLSNGVFSMGNARLVYERNLLQAREGVTRSHHVIELLQGSSKQYDVHSRTWFASTIDDVIVAKFKCISTTSDSDGCLSVLIGLARDRRPAQLTSLFRITNWFRRRDYSSREFDTGISISLSSFIS